MEPGHPDLELDLLATVFDVARIGICVIDEAGRFARVNPAFCELVTYPADRRVGSSRVAGSFQTPGSCETRSAFARLVPWHSGKTLQRNGTCLLR